MTTADKPPSGGSLGTHMGETTSSPIYRDGNGNAHATQESANSADWWARRLADSFSVIGEVKNVDPGNIQEVAASQLALSNSYYKNVLNQARRSFAAAIVSAIIGLAFFISAILILTLRNEIQAGTVSAISGGIVEVISGLNFWLYGRTATQLNAFHVRLDQTQKYLIANSIATKLEGPALETALTNLINQVASSQNLDTRSKGNPKDSRRSS